LASGRLLSLAQSVEKRDKVSCLQHFIVFGHWPV
jgi:hypothetical protein